MSSRSSTTDLDPEAPVLVGVVRKPHGVRGEVAVESHSDAPGRFAAGSELRIEVPGVAPRRLTVRASRPHGRALLVSFEGIEDRDRAEELRGGALKIDREHIAPAPDGEFYYFELVGCRCTDRAAGEIGVVTDVLEDGGGQLLVVESGSSSWLVPFVAAHLVAVDTAAGTIDLDLPEGLLETCRSES